MLGDGGEPNGFESRRNDAEPEPEREEGSEAEESRGGWGRNQRRGIGLVIFLFYVGKKGGWIPKNSCGVLEVRSIFCVFFQ